VKNPSNFSEAKFHFKYFGLLWVEWRTVEIQPWHWCHLAAVAQTDGLRVRRGSAVWASAARWRQSQGLGLHSYPTIIAHCTYPENCIRLSPLIFYPGHHEVIHGTVFVECRVMVKRVSPGEGRYLVGRGAGGAHGPHDLRRLDGCRRPHHVHEHPGAVPESLPVFSSARIGFFRWPGRRPSGEAQHGEGGDCDHA